MASTRDRLIAATNELFRRSGYHGTSLKAVTTAAEATVGSLYHFFPGGKVELARAVLIETGVAYGQLFELLTADEPDAVAAIGGFFDAAATTLEEIDFVDLCAIGTVAREVASTEETLRVAADRVVTGWTELVAGRFVAEGLDDATAEGLAMTVIGALEGGFVLARTRRDGDVLRAIGQQMSDLVALRLDGDRESATSHSRHVAVDRRS